MTVTNPPVLPVVGAQQAAWWATGAVAEMAGGRGMAFGNQAVLTSGTLRLAGLLVLPRGRTCTTGLTDPASLGASAAAITGASQMFWGYVS